VEPATS